MEHEDIMWIEFAKTDLGVAEHLDKQYYPKPLKSFAITASRR